MKLMIEFDYFGSYHRAATWLQGRHVVALASSWLDAELRLREMCFM